ncbi:MAG: thioredoxin-dependent thiol peroxidase [Gemmatimonadetes bacterium]|nr:thioredoxin-dependent thiol peroxidase [Gemmatimonadota bacterium]MBT8402670.1 thioredoxin-dependent thiol peroxidase [Gemmatimonadota bacterium]NNK63077.1 thioredoxin-dependent thiol peroxidase [Gemmatimonadota bacterium]
MIDIGDQAPDFSLPADDGSTVSLSDFRGRRLVLYFYPKDDTSGCTAQACELRDDLPAFSALGVDVVGVSPDPVASHVKFKTKYDLNFPLLADEDHVVSQAYGVWQEKSMYGRKYMGIVRSTFLIGTDGRIEGSWRKVKARGHAAFLRDQLAAL